MGLFHFLLVVFAVVAAALVGVILMQRSEGGGLGMGGSPSGLMSARGAGDFLTRTTAILATLFVGLAIAMAFVSAKRGAPAGVDETLERAAPATQQQTVDPTAAPANAPAADKAAPASPASDVPLDK
ncbi:preprotein translocase subunit SecG [uncultured Sphingorhabdus sp.]|jgi:preprotein translocase subunit SecG|uniref:preprotein translocase subunit SecG n=1 Tax=uncultured Sphingorhabdus sp. TaxID=1686106 RepID=UPI002613536B|nr:preprotein translocase subunit SecG [uncultured Sphingorhabdus sp.]HMS18965.1 preprotein translocase subunit SecG [Sphingorhabdus sp.]